MLNLHICFVPTRMRFNRQGVWRESIQCSQKSSLSVFRVRRDGLWLTIWIIGGARMDYSQEGEDDKIEYGEF